MTEASKTKEEQRKPPEYSVERTIQSVHDIGDGVFSINRPHDDGRSDERAAHYKETRRVAS